MNKPEWWPECPYPEDVFPGEARELVEVIPDGALRTRLAGVVGRHFWQLAEDAIWERWHEYLSDNLEGENGNGN